MKHWYIWEDERKEFEVLLGVDLSKARLKTLADYINANFPFFRAVISQEEVSTDRPCGRLRIPGKGRIGNRLDVYKDGERVFQHSSAETYRHNWEVVRWIAGQKKSGK